MRRNTSARGTSTPEAPEGTSQLWKVGEAKQEEQGGNFKRTLKRIFQIFKVEMQLFQCSPPPPVTSNTYSFFFFELQRCSASVLHILHLIPYSSAMPVNSYTTVFIANSVSLLKVEMISYFLLLYPVSFQGQVKRRALRDNY